MASDQEIQQAIHNIHEKWSNPPARMGVYGNILKSVTIYNLRQMHIQVEFTWPVTAVGGVNGSGKSTVIQICSTAYSQIKGGRYYRIGDWIRTALPGETPAIGPNAKVTFTFWDGTVGYEVPHTPARRRWKYPSRAPLRHVVFLGITSFAPRIEKRDRLHLFRAQLEIKESHKIDDRIIQSVSRILGHTYQGGHIHTISSPGAKWSDKLPQIERAGSVYTEPHMGAGEQKVVRLVQTLEAIPDKSLIVLEEPEITLHPDAQRGLAWYLMALSARKGHQILIATHSSDIFDSLPKEARVLLIRSGAGVEALHNVPSLRAARELARTVNTNKCLILVEDLVAKSFLDEILRRHNRSLHVNSVIVPVGNTDDVYRMVIAFRKQGVKAIGVRDPDIGANEQDGLLALPGNKAPEALLLSDENVGKAEEFLSGIKDACDRARAVGLGRSGSAWAKSVFSALPSELTSTREAVADRLTLAWLSNHKEEATDLVKDIERLLEHC